MTPRIVVTSGDPATGVITIEQVPDEPCSVCHGSGSVSIFSTSTVGLRGCSDCRASGRVPLSLPATVEVTNPCSCDGGDYTTSEGEVLEHVGGNSRCGGSGFVVLGTATIKGLWRYENLRRFADNGEGFGPLPPEAYRGRLYVWRDDYDALTPGGLVAYLTDWNPT